MNPPRVLQILFMKKLIKIIKSRFKKEPKEKWVMERRKICKTCPYNTKNQQTLSLKVRVYKKLSDFLTWITLSENEDLGSCGHETCGCDVYFKTMMEEEQCSDIPPKWKSIYKPNTGQEKKWK